MSMGRKWMGSASGALIVLSLLAAPGQAAGAAASFNPDPLDFGNVQSGSALGYVTATNLASTPRTFRDTESSLGAGFSPDDNLDPTTGRDQACYSHGPSFTNVVEVAPGDSCRLYYRFDATATGTFSAQPQIQVKDPSSSVSEIDSIVLKAASFTPDPATTGAFTVSPTSLGFGNVDVGQTKTLTTTLSNSSNGNVQVHTAYPADSPFSTASSSTCNQPGGPALVLAPHDTCTVAVTFEPVLNGAVSGSVSISLTPATGIRGSVEPYSSTTRLAKKSTALRGTGVGPKFTLTPTSLSFGTETTYGGKVLPVTVKNTSTVPLAFGTSYDSTTPYDVQLPVGLQDPNCLGGQPADNGGPPGELESRSQVIAAGKSCVLSVAFAPVTKGTPSATIPIQAYDGLGTVGTWRDLAGRTASGGLNLKASGTAVDPTYTVSRTSLAFGNVTQTDAERLAVTFKNTSTIPLQFGSSLPSDSTFAVVPADGPTSCMSEQVVPPQNWDDPPQGTILRRYRVVAPGASCTVTFRFAPTELGAASQAVPVEVYRIYDGTGFKDAGAAVGVRQLGATGTGVAPTFTFTPTSLAFGQRTVASYKTIVIAVKNTSPVPLQFGSSLGEESVPYRLAVPATDTGANCMRRYTVTQFPDPDQVVTEHRLVAPGKSCTLTFGYYPLVVGASSAQLPVEYYEPSSGSTFQDAGVPLGSRTIKATGASVAPTFTFTPGTIAFGNVTVGGTKAVAVTVKNTSDAYLAFGSTYPTQSVPYRFVAPSDAPQGASCVYQVHLPGELPGDPGTTETHYRTVAPGGACVLTFAFGPQSTGTAPAGSFPVEVYDAYGIGGQYWSSTGPQRASGNVKASGNGVKATFTLSPSSLAFGTVAVGGSKTLTTVIKNTSSSPASYAVTIPRSTYRIAFVTDHDPADCIAHEGDQLSYVTVASGASCDLRIDFAPSASGTDNQTIAVDAYAPYGDPGFYEPDPGYQVTGTKSLPVTGKGG